MWWIDSLRHPRVCPWVGQRPKISPTERCFIQIKNVGKRLFVVSHCSSRHGALCQSMVAGDCLSFQISNGDSSCRRVGIDGFFAIMAIFSDTNNGFRVLWTQSSRVPIAPGWHGLFLVRPGLGCHRQNCWQCRTASAWVVVGVVDARCVVFPWRENHDGDYSHRDQETTAASRLRWYPIHGLFNIRISNNFDLQLKAGILEFPFKLRMLR